MDFSASSEGNYMYMWGRAPIKGIGAYKFAERPWGFLGEELPGRFLCGNAIFGYQLERFFLPKWKIQLQTEVTISWVQLSGGFCSFPWFSTNRGLLRCSIYKGNIEENQGNEQNPPANCTQEIVTSVWSRIFHFGKKNLSNWYPNIAFPQRNGPGSSYSKNVHGLPANLYAPIPLIGDGPHIHCLVILNDFYDC